jgi:hypothetical protein
MEEIVLRMKGQEVQPDDRRVASYLLARDKKPIIIMRFRAVDAPKLFVRLFSRVKSSQDTFNELIRSHRLFRNRPCAFVLEKWYGKNAELAPPSPPFKFPKHDENATSPTPKNHIGE